METGSTPVIMVVELNTLGTRYISHVDGTGPKNNPRQLLAKAE